MSFRVAGRSARCRPSQSVLFAPSPSCASHSPLVPLGVRAFRRGGSRRSILTRRLPTFSRSFQSPSRSSVRRQAQVNSLQHTNSVHTSQFQPLRPPSPESLGKAAPPKQYYALRRWGRRLFYVSTAVGVFYLIDNQFYASSMTRSLRTFGTGLIVAIDYKLNFRPDPWFGGDIPHLHMRNAERLSELLRHNGGLYLKVCNRRPIPCP